MPDFSQASSTATLTPVRQDLTPLNTLGLSAWAEAFVTLRSVDQLNALSDLADQYSRLLVLGGGSNVLIAAAGVRGL